MTRRDDPQQDYGELRHPQQVDIDEICDRFEAEFKAGARPNADDFVALIESDLRSSLAGELLAIELHYRSGEADSILEMYRQRFPNGLPAQLAQNRHPDTEQQLEPGTQLGDFCIERQVGQGGMGVVYEARDTKLDRQVALKFLPAQFAEDQQRLTRFEREARILAGLNHPNIATLYGFDEHDGLQFCVMEFVPGRTLAETLVRRGMPLSDVIPVFIQIAASLESAHDAGVIHRDLKPANVKVTPGGLVKVLDFGLAKSSPASRPDIESDSQVANSQKTHSQSRQSLTDDDTSETGLSPTQAAGISGTLPYMSPEQTQGKPVDKRGDIWSYGCCLYEALTGKRAFSGQHADDVFEAVNRHSPDWDALPVNTPPRLDQLLRRCLVKDSQQRLRDIGEARIELASLQNGAATLWNYGRLMRSRIASRTAIQILSTAIASMILTGLIMRGWLGSPDQPVRISETRTSVNLPPDLQLSGLVSIAISPDGSRTAYVAEGVDQVSHLYVRDTNRFEAVKLEGTEFAQSPFFSPDGRQIAFFANDSLKTVSVLGSPPKILFRGGFFGGGCWTPKHGILFTWDWGGELVQVSADGSKRRILLRNDTGRMGWPQLLPNGQVLFVSNGKIFLTSVAPLDQAETAARPRKLSLGKRVQFARYLSTGHLLYAHQGSLLSVPFQLNPPRISGEEALIASDLATHASAADFAVSVSRDIVYVPGTPTYIGELVWVSRRDNKTQLAWDGVRQYSSFKLSPDGKKLAIGVVEDDGTSVWIYDFENTTSSLLTADGDSERPIWTPDGERVVFRGTRAGQEGLYWTTPGSQQLPELLTSLHEAQTPVCFGKDGMKLIHYSARAGSDRGGIFELDIKTRGVTPLLNSPDQNEVFGDLSPDGQWLVYLSSKANRNYEVFIGRYPEMNETYRVSGVGDHYEDNRPRLDPMWSPEGDNTIFFWNGKIPYGRVMAATIAFDPFRVLAIEPAVTQASIDLLGYAYDYDRKQDRFLVVRPAGDVKPAREIRWLRNPLRD